MTGILLGHEPLGIHHPDDSVFLPVEPDLAQPFDVVVRGVEDEDDTSGLTLLDRLGDFVAGAEAHHGFQVLKLLILRDRGEVTFDEPRLGCPRDHATGFREGRDHEKASTVNAFKQLTATIKAQQHHVIQELENRQSMKIAELQQAHARALQEIKDSILSSFAEAGNQSSSTFAKSGDQHSSTSGNKSISSPFAKSAGNQYPSTFGTTGNKSISSPFAKSSNKSVSSTFEAAGTNSLSSFGEAGNKSSSTFAEVGKKEPELSIKPAPKRKAVEVISLSDDDDQPSLVNPRSQDLKYGTARRRTQLRKVMEAASKFALPFAAPSSSSSAPTFKHPSFLVGGGATTAERLSQMIRPETAFPGFPNVTESRTNWIVTTRHTLTNMGVRKSDLVVNLEAVKYYLMPAYETDRRAHEIYDRYMDPHTAPGKVTGGWAWAPIKELLLMLEEMPESLDCNDLHELLAFFKYRFPKTLSGKLK
ncbi:hypothetical protein BC567DRAFT_261009 [Phyllosticta citribraziliensis]